MAARIRGLLIAADYAPLPGGIARLLSELIRTSHPSVEWRILTNAAGPAEPAVFRGSTSALVASLPRQVRWLKAADEAFVACGHLKLLGLALVAGRLAGASVGTIVYGKELLPRRRLHRLAVGILPRSDHVVAISGYTADVALGCGVGRHQIRTVLPVLRPSWSGCKPNPRRSGEGLRVIAVTRLAEGYKNLEVVLRMVKVLSTTGFVERLTVVGGGPRLPALQRKVDRLGITHLVRLTGPVDDETLAVLLGEAHVGLFPSRRSITEAGFEGFGLVVQELAAAGLPMIVGGCAGALDAALPEWSLLVDPDDLRAWIDATAWLAANEDERMRMGEAAATWAESIDPTETARHFVEAIRA
jgi:glycosyltransferase involved in cell wall biosynthesis